MLAYLTLAIFAAASAPIAQAHVAMFHPSMWGINITSASDPAFDYDNRPVAPLFNMDFQKWWFHNHLDFPPAEGQFFDLPAGGSSTAEVACTKSATSFFDVGKDDGGDIRGQNGASLNDPCPGSPSSEWHTNGINDTTGCALAITYQSDERAVQPEVRPCLILIVVHRAHLSLGLYHLQRQPHLRVQPLHRIPSS
jgi:hypothetical protein